MKAVKGWVCDPYVHVFAAALVAVVMAASAGRDEPAEAAFRVSRCRHCLSTHERENGCARFELPAAAPEGE